MASFATVAELGSFCDRTFDDADPRATLALELASALIENECRQRLDEVTDDVITLRRGARALVLPEPAAADVTSITIDGATLTADEWILEAGTLRRTDGTDWSLPAAITYTHGYASAPPVIKGLTLAVASRIIDNPTTLGAEAVAGYNATFRAGGLELTDDERRALDPYRAPEVLA